jgi:hypothetical protein
MPQTNHTKGTLSTPNRNKLKIKKPAKLMPGGSKVERKSLFQVDMDNVSFRFSCKLNAVVLECSDKRGISAQFLGVV